jgi:hypothetical protein
VLETGSVSFGVAVRDDLVAPKMVEDFPPRRIRRRTATMAFIDYDQIEEAGRKLAIELLPVFRPGDCLIEPEINLEGGTRTVSTPFLKPAGSRRRPVLWWHAFPFGRTELFFAHRI